MVGRSLLFPGTIEEASGTEFDSPVRHCVQLSLIASIYLQPYSHPATPSPPQAERIQSEVQHQATAQLKVHSGAPWILTLSWSLTRNGVECATVQIVQCVILIYRYQKPGQFRRYVSWRKLLQIANGSSVALTGVIRAYPHYLPLFLCSLQLSSKSLSILIPWSSLHPIRCHTTSAAEIKPFNNLTLISITF